MKVALTTILLLVAAAVLSVNAETSQHHSYEFGLGFPRGHMDISCNGSLNLRLLANEQWRLRSVIHESVAAKRQEGEWVAMNALAGYLLARYVFRGPTKETWMFFEFGGGLHHVASLSPAGIPGYGKWESLLVGKGHIFFGADYSLGSDRLLSLKTRFTYPSDLLLDAVYFNYGIRF